MTGGVNGRHFNRTSLPASVRVRIIFAADLNDAAMMESRTSNQMGGEEGAIRFKRSPLLGAHASVGDHAD